MGNSSLRLFEVLSLFLFGARATRITISPCEKRSGPVEECYTLERNVASSKITGDAVFCHCPRPFVLCLELVQPSKEFKTFRHD